MAHDGGKGHLAARRDRRHHGGTERRARRDDPYTPEALAKRNDNGAKWPAADPEAKCYMLGVPRVTYHNMPFQIFQADGDLLMVYPFAAANRVIYMSDRELPVDSWRASPTERGTATCWSSRRNGRTDSHGSIAPATMRAIS